MTSNELKSDMIIDCIHNWAADVDLLIIKSIHNEMIFCERFYSDEFLKGCNWKPLIIDVDTWDDKKNYLWSTFSQITKKEAIIKFFKGK